MILDTTFLIDLLNRESVADEKLDELIEATTPVSVSTLTVFEVGVGLRESEREQFEAVIEPVTIAPLGLAESWRAVHIQRTLRDAGQEIGIMDALIAGTAAERTDSTVLTRNVDEFERVDVIDVETY